MPSFGSLVIRLAAETTIEYSSSPCSVLPEPAGKRAAWSTSSLAAGRRALLGGGGERRAGYRRGGLRSGFESIAISGFVLTGVERGFRLMDDFPGLRVSWVLGISERASAVGLYQE
jgi:hypothetical protein